MTSQFNHTSGQLLIVSAPSGAGKTSLINALLEADNRVEVSVSYTTRPMRHGEVDGVNYHFITRETFLAKKNQGNFFEWAEVFGHFYGTGIEEIETRLARGAEVILEIDWQGAQQVRQQRPDSVWIFIVPPAVNELKERLQTRGQDGQKTIDSRMGAARDEISHWEEADYLIVNEQFDEALENLVSIVRALRLQTNRKEGWRNALIESLLDEKRGTN